MVHPHQLRPRDEAAELLECYIAEHQLQPHQKLPAERKLCELWQVNRSTLRSAIHKLVVEGKLYSKVGSGTFVAPPKLVRNLQDMEFMGSVAAKAGKRLTSRVIAMDVIESNKQISQKLKIPLGHRVFALSRLRFIDEVPTMIETGYINYNYCAGIEKYDFAERSLYETLVGDYDLDPIQGQEKLSITYTTGEEADLLQVPEGTAVFFLSGVSCGQLNQPIEYFKSVVRADQIRFSSMLTR